MNLIEETNTRIESELEVRAYIQNLKFALNHEAKINFQAKRLVDDNRDEKFTNQYTVNALFPDENPVDVLKRELLSLNVEDYMRTVKDFRFPKRSEMREFGKVYNGADDVYIKKNKSGTFGYIWSDYNFCNVVPFCREGIHTGNVSIQKELGGAFMDMKVMKSEKNSVHVVWRSTK